MNTVPDKQIREESTSSEDSCRGMPPLKARLEPWMREIARNEQLTSWVEQYGSPLNILNTSPFQRNIESLRQEGVRAGIDLELFFARKANKCLSFAQKTAEIGCGVDVASLPELDQVLACGVATEKIVCTAAIKTEALIRRCIENKVLVVLDNIDELELVRAVADEENATQPIAVRLGGFEYNGKRLESRFGFQLGEVVALANRYFQPKGRVALDLRGLHFHLDGYCPEQRIAAIRQCLELSDSLTRDGHHIEFIDCGGGIPMSYLEKESEWDRFWKMHRDALLSKGREVTFANDSYGTHVYGNQILGTIKKYPFYQKLTQAAWLRSILSSVADELRKREVQLRFEPGRSALDGCGVTVAEVVFRKRHSNGEPLIGLAMNRTQCRTSSVDFFADPILARRDSGRTPSQRQEGYLVGAYCTESEYLSLRRFEFPEGISIGDFLIFPNTAGYFMHFLESRSHQFKLAQNVFVTESSRLNPSLDDIDCEWLNADSNLGV